MTPGANLDAKAPAVESETEKILAFLHRLVRDSEQVNSLNDLLREVAEVFAAAEAGLATPVTGNPQVLYTGCTDRLDRGQAPPWGDFPEILTRVNQSLSAVPVSRPDGSWLMTAAWQLGAEGWLVWLRGEPGREWSAGECAVFALTAQTLVRLARDRNGTSRWAPALECARTQTQLEHTAHVSGRLAHDFSNILTGILGFTELSMSQAPADSLAQRYMQEVWHAAQQGAQWLQRLQLCCRRNRPNVLPVALGAVVVAEEARLRCLWEGQVTFLISLADRLPALAMDADSLRQVLAELLENAREAIPDKGVVALSARAVELTDLDCREMLGSPRPGPHVEVTITDTGVGISPDVRQRLFHEVFYSTKTRRRGLGLSMVYGILQSFQGGLRLGPDPEHGTTIRVFLPVAGQTAPTLANFMTQPEVVAARVLLVDDDPLILESLSKSLEKVGFRVRAVPSAAEAIALYTKPGEPFRLVISDIHMPRMNGLELAQRLLQHDANLNLLFISSNPGLEAKQQHPMLRRFSVLPKPFDPQILVQAVHASLTRNGVSRGK